MSVHAAVTPTVRPTVRSPILWPEATAGPTIPAWVQAELDRITTGGGTVTDDQFVSDFLVALEGDAAGDLYALFDAIWLPHTITKDGGNAVSKWWDVSGSDYDAVQGTGADQSTWVDNVLDGEPIIRFDNSKGGFTATPAQGNQPFTLFAIVERDDTTAQHHLFMGASNRLFRFNSGGHVIRFKWKDTNLETAGITDSTEWARVTGLANTVASTVRWGGVEKASGDVGNDNFLAATTLYLGEDSAGANVLDGDVALMGFCHTSLTTAQRDAIEAVFAATWATPA